MASLLTKSAGATWMVAPATARNAIWLVPYTSPSLPTRTRIIHGSLFAFTLESLVFGCVVVVAGLQRSVDATTATNHNDSDDVKSPSEVILGPVASAVCWIISLVLYLRHWLKRRRRANILAQLHRASTQEMCNTYTYESIHSTLENAEQDDLSLEHEEDSDDIVPTRPSPWIVILLTILGALDKLSYFSSLLVGRMFSPLDLCLGTFFAACIILLIMVAISILLPRCKPLLDWLYRLPRYGMVSAFAVVLTTCTIVDTMSV
mmetsp:Transcript_16104/g.24441  ORF Transcript_16104/g.24441 Transcript_16104/m.24441 type:complete len:262 (-) Transcript_16104:341-1126(-)